MDIHIKKKTLCFDIPATEDQLCWSNNGHSYYLDYFSIVSTQIRA